MALLLNERLHQKKKKVRWEYHWLIPSGPILPFSSFPAEGSLTRTEPTAERADLNSLGQSKASRLSFLFYKESGLTGGEDQYLKKGSYR